MLSFHFFSQSVEEAFSIFPWQQRGTLGKASSCGNLFEMSENLAVRSLGPMSGHFRVRSLGRMSGHCKAEACFGWVTVAVRFSERLNCRMIVRIATGTSNTWACMRT